MSVSGDTDGNNLMQLYCLQLLIRTIPLRDSGFDFCDVVAKLLSC